MAVDISKIRYADLDYNIKKQFKGLFVDTALQRCGTIVITKEEFHRLYAAVFESKVREMIIDFYSRFKIFEPEFTEEDLREYYSVNVAKITQ